MTRAATIAFALALCAPALAHARGRHCHETSPVVGYQRCGRFGSTWSAGPTLAIDVGATALSLALGPGDRALAYGGTFGERFHLSRWLYLGGDMTMGAIAMPPIASAAARDATMASTTTSTMIGGFGQAVFVLGAERALGPLAFGLESGPGLRIVELSPNDGLAQFVFDARVRAVAWVSPHWSLGVQASADLAHPGSYALGVFLGGHLIAYDNTR